MTTTVRQRRETLVAELGRAEQVAQQALQTQQQAAVTAERLRGAIALCDELLTAEMDAEQPGIA